jgi:hypothetical protein
MFVFGGISYENNETLADLWSFDFNDARWTFEGYFEPRAGHSLTADNQGRLWLVGGFADWEGDLSSDSWSHEVWAYDTTDAEWANWTPIEYGLPALAYHGAALVGPYLFVHGGLSAESRISNQNEVEPINADFYEHLYFFDITTESAAEAAWIREEIAPSKPRPPARGAHIVVSSTFHAGRILVFGGAHDDRETLADIWEYTAALGAWKQLNCYPGYEFPFCKLDCRSVNHCNNHGVCLGNGVCHCDEGWLGATCDYNVCDGYRGFGYRELNEILLPKSIEAIYIKLDVIKKKLELVEDLLPSIDCDNFDGQYADSLHNMASKSYEFYQECLVDNLLEVTTGFETAIGCDVSNW